MYGFITVLLTKYSSVFIIWWNTQYINYELKRFPPRSYCMTQYTLLGERIQHLKDTKPLLEYRRHQYDEQIRYLQEVRTLYDLISDIHGDQFCLRHRLDKLYSLEHLLGESEYLLGQLPIPGEDY